jgi:predicted protein tyrosine phosphatase
MRLLFVCSRNRLRSPTAENVFAGYDGLETRSAGTAKDAEYQVGADDLEWADLILVMERQHAKRLRQMFPSNQTRIVVLGIPDQYELMQPELVALLEAKTQPFL